MKSLKLTAVVFTLCGAAACGAPAPKSGPSSDTPTESQDIVGGQPTNEFTAVGLFVNAPAQSQWSASCTASLIASRSVLTAAHCVLGIGSNGEETAQVANPGDLSFVVGSNSYRASAINLPGGSSFPLQRFVSNLQAGKLNDDDIAVVNLQEAPSITPMTLSTQALSMNQKVYSVGFGTTGGVNDDTGGTKREMYTFISGFVDNNIVQAGTATYGTCTGDSGGPMIPSYNTIVAITQAGAVQNNTCAGNDDFTLVAPWASFISSAAQ